MIAPSAAVAIPQPSERAGTRQWLGLALLVLPTLLLAADITVLYLALPLLSADLGPTGTETLWIIDLYGFVLASLLITMGTVGDRIGRRRLLMIGAVTFGLAALLAAYAMSPATLIVARAFMGVAGAIMLPSTVALIATMFQEPAQRTQAIGVWAASFSAGIALGPLVGGGLLESFWWGSVFLVNVLVMGMVVGMAPLVLPEDRSSVVGRIDVPSMTLSLAAVIATIYGIKELAHGGMAVRADVAIAAGLLAGVAFVRRQSRLTDPLLDVSLFRGRTFSGAVAVLLVGMATIGGIYLFVTQYLQFVEGLTPIAAGLWLLPSATALVVSSMLTPVVARRARPSHVVVAARHRRHRFPRPHPRARRRVEPIDQWLHARLSRDRTAGGARHGPGRGRSTGAQGGLRSGHRANQHTTRSSPRHRPPRKCRQRHLPNPDERSRTRQHTHRSGCRRS